jgi:hypothetical protein
MNDPAFKTDLANAVPATLAGLFHQTCACIPVFEVKKEVPVNSRS